MLNAKKIFSILPIAGSLLLSSCGAPEYEFDTDFHITEERVAQEAPESDTADIPDLIGSTAELPELKYEGSSDIFDVVVDSVSVRTVFLSLADQAQLNLDLDPKVDGPVTLNAYGQTLAQLLERIRKQVAIRYETIGGTLVVLKDDFYLKQYHLDFPDLSRTFSASSDGSVSSSGTGSLGTSSISIIKEGSGSVWLELEETIEVLITGLAAINPQATYGPTSNSEEDIDTRSGLGILHQRQPDNSQSLAFFHLLPAAGLIILYGTSQHHDIVSSVINQLAETSVRQVQLQATVVEISLNNQYQQGIDWSIFNAGNSDLNLLQSASKSVGSIFENTVQEELESRKEILEILYPIELDEAGSEAIAAANRQTVLSKLNVFATERAAKTSSGQGGFFSFDASINELDVAVSLLDQFGDTRVVSSPRVSTLNGQPAILKVVEDQVYFRTTKETEIDEAGVRTESVSVEEQVIPVGFVVSVYPQVSKNGSIILSMRPSISRVTGYAFPPSDTGGTASSSPVPIISVKEIETLMRLQDGQTAVMGGMIEDQLQDTDSGIPGASRIPGFGNLFKNIDQKTRRVEYVIFVSANIITNPSIYGDYSDYQDLLPSDETFRRDKTTTFFDRDVKAVPRTVK